MRWSLPSATSYNTLVADRRKLGKFGLTFTRFELWWSDVDILTNTINCFCRSYTSQGNSSDCKMEISFALVVEIQQLFAQDWLYLWKTFWRSEAFSDIHNPPVLLKRYFIDWCSIIYTTDNWGSEYSSGSGPTHSKIILYWAPSHWQKKIPRTRLPQKISQEPSVLHQCNRVVQIFSLFSALRR